MDRNIVTPLVERAIKGDDQAYARLCEHIIKDVLYICVVITKNQQTGEDAAQEVLIQLKRTIKTLNNPDSFIPWLNRCIRNVCSNTIRKERRGVYLPLDSIQDEVMEHNIEFLPSEWAEQEDRRRGVIASLKELPFKQQHILFMYYFEGMSLKEIAQTLETSENNAAVSLHRARRALKRRIEKQYGKKLSEQSFQQAGYIATLTRIFQEELKVVVTEESCKKVLVAAAGEAIASGVATAGALAGGAAAATAATAGGLAGAGLGSLGALGLSAATVLTAVAVATGVYLTNAPAPSSGLEQQPVPQQAEQMQEPEEGVWAASEPELEPEDDAENEVQSPPETSLPEEQAPPEEGPAHMSYFGRVVFQRRDGTQVPAAEVDLSGATVYLKHGDTVVAEAQVSATGRYRLQVSAQQSLAGCVLTADFQREDFALAAGSVAVGSLPGQSLPELRVTDVRAPEGSVRFTDAGGVTHESSVGPAHAQLLALDATATSASYAITRPDGTQVRTGQGAQASLGGLAANGRPTRYTITFTVEDMAGNTTEVSREFIIMP